MICFEEINRTTAPLGTDELAVGLRCPSRTGRWRAGQKMASSNWLGCSLSACERQRTQDCLGQP